MARYERSAGVVVFVTATHGRLFLLLDYGRYWDLPKGHVEKDEDDLAAATRELAEETGITSAKFIDDFRHEIQYFFRGPGGLIRKTVVFFLAQAKTQKVTISHEHVGFEFLTYEAALKRLKYPTAKAVLKAAEDFLSSRV
jgi:8-oxo-dGTP pyrophosphatase MutT (NUDIX family)